MVAPVAAPPPRARFDRNELSGAFGDIGTDFPLLVGLVLASGLDAASVLIMFGLTQVLTGLVYGIPMPAQPLKAVAVLVITQKLGAGVLYGGGLAIGAAMLLLAATGLVDAVARTIPRVVVRGIQLGLGLQLALLALREYVPADGGGGYALAAASFVLVLALLGNRRCPPAPFAILLGALYALAFQVDRGALAGGVGLRLPRLYVPTPAEVWTGFLLLALPQIPLSLCNSVLATRQVVADLFPHRPVTARKISLTYAAMNLVSPLFSGVPTCHGSGGLAGHFAFGGRTGGSVIIYGALYLGLGLFLSGGFQHLALLFPRPVLGVILFFEALALMRLVRDTAASPAQFSVALLVGLLAVGLPYGYLVGLVVGTIVARLGGRSSVGFTAAP